MGMMENGTQEHKSNMIEQSKTSENIAQDPKCDPLTLDNYRVESDRLVNESLEQIEVSEAQNTENKLVSIEDSKDKLKEMGPNQGEISQDVGAEKQEVILENVKTLPVVERLEVVSQNGLTSMENMGVYPETACFTPSNGNIKPANVGVTGDSGHLDNEVTNSSGQLKKRKTQSKGRVTSSWSLRSKSQEKPKAPEPNDVVKEGSASGEKKRRGRKKKQTIQKTTNEFSRSRNHLRYLLHRIKYEQNLIDAYSAEGWKGQSLEKLKPEKELQRARSHILRYKLKIRALFQQLDQSLAEGKLPESLFDTQGEIDSEDIFCAKCGSKDLTLENDIILCDGACERGFHQFCLEPPLLKEDIPPGDEGWICPGCDCKLYCIDMLKDFQGTKISITDSWEKIFPEAASGKRLDDGNESSSDDSEDDDYDPETPDTAEKIEGDESSSDESDYFSAPDDLAASLNTEKYLGLPSEDSEDDDFDPSVPDQETEVKEDSSSSDFTSDSEDLGAVLEDDMAPGESLEQISPISTSSKEENSKVRRPKRQSLKDELSYLAETSTEPVCGKRRVERLDYKKLHDETFGNSFSDSSDEDFDDTTTPKRRKSDNEKSEVKLPSKNPTTKSNMNTKGENQIPKRSWKSVDGGTNESSAEVGSSSTGSKRSAYKRLGEAATQGLYAAFKENQHPQKAAKENLAKELGLTPQQVSKWFENARWSFNHRPQLESNSTGKSHEPQPTIGTGNTPSNQNTENQKEER